jgi:hypothetical protein
MVNPPRAPAALTGFCYQPVRMPMYSLQAVAAHLRHPARAYNDGGYFASGDFTL